MALRLEDVCLHWFRPFDSEALVKPILYRHTFVDGLPCPGVEVEVEAAAQRLGAPILIIGPSRCIGCGTPLKETNLNGGKALPSEIKVTTRSGSSWRGVRDPSPLTLHPNLAYSRRAPSTKWGPS